MRRNRTAYFLVISFALLSLVFYKLLPGDSKEKDSDKSDDTEIKSENNSEMKSEDEKNDVNNQNGSIQKESDELGEKQSQKVSSNENDVISNDQGNQNKEWEEFYRNEKNILRSGYQKGEGNEGDDVKFLVNPDGIEVNYFKKKKAKKINVDVGLSMTSQNIFSWNGIIADENLKTTLVVDNGNGAVFQKDVTGLSSFKFKPGDTRFDGVKCSIKLIIETKEGISIQGVREIKAKTTC